MTYLVTGGMGCIGAWVIQHLQQRGDRVVNFDFNRDRHRLDALMRREEQQEIIFVQGDLTNFETLRGVLDQHEVSHIIHLAALQVPACRENPALGAQVNVVGTVNVFEAARQVGISHLVYASSIAVYGPPQEYPPGLITHDALMKPRTLYGVYKVANEGTAQVYWQDHGLTSTALRPYTVYGVGRDQGLTSEPTKAMAAAVRGEDYHISFGGKMQFHLASDVALQFITAADHPLGGALGFNLGTPPVAVAKVTELIMSQKPGVRITVEDKPLPFPEGCDSAPLHDAFEQVYETPIAEGIARTLAHFKELRRQ